MERLLVTGDIHGKYKQFCEVLEKADFNPEKDQLILIGDYIDRGNQSRKVVKKVKNLTNQGVIALKGNHEDMAYKYVKSIENNEYKDNGIYFMNGGRKTINSYSTTSEFKKDIKWLNDLPEKYIFEEKYIFVHAGLKPRVKFSNQKSKDLLWIREEFFLYDWEKDNNVNETIVAGHTPVQKVKFLPGIILIDTGAGKGGYLSLVDLTNKKIYTSKKN